MVANPGTILKDIQYSIGKCNFQKDLCIGSIDYKLGIRSSTHKSMFLLMKNKPNNSRFWRKTKQFELFREK